MRHPDEDEMVLKVFEDARRDYSEAIDPLSRALGHLEGQLDGIDKRLEALERYVVWGFGITWTLVIATGVFMRLVAR
jgi:hypothetical protein